MKILPSELAIRDFEGDAVVVGIYEGELSPTADQLDNVIGGAISRLISAEEITGKPGSLTTILAPAGLGVLQVIAVGLGEKEKLDYETVYRAAASATKILSTKQRSKVGFYLDDLWPSDLTQQAIAGACVGCQGQDLYQTKKSSFQPELIEWFGADAATVETGTALGNSINLTRTLVNRPAADIYPISFADEVAVVAEAHDLEIEIWDQKKMEQEKCGSLLAVSQGSDQPPRLAIVRYNGGKQGDAPLALVGKGVTFDSGGLSLKPSEGMKAMKCDMGGAATVLGAIKAIAALKVPVNVVGLVGLAENMVSGNCYKLGDVLTARSGKTIEVLNTDAEGRLVLADVLNVALDEKPACIIDLATLTGACVVALGENVAGLMTNDQPWCDAISAASAKTGEPMWQLPMYPEFSKQIKSKVADIKNVGSGRWGGVMTAAKFLEEFVDETTWTHIDIAGPAFSDNPKAWVDAGASGFGVRTLLEVARNLAK